MKRTIVSLSLMLMFAVAAFAQSSNMQTKTAKGCCGACCGDKCGKSCCQSGCTGACCQGK
jgi:hypothetical protein